MTLVASTRARRSVVVLAATALVLTLMPVHGLAAPTTPEIEAKKAEAEAAQSKLDELGVQLEMRTEEYAAAVERLRETDSAIAQAEDELARADRELAAARSRLEERAAGIYRGGGVDILEVLLGTTSFQDFITRVDWLRRVNMSDAELVSAVKAAREEVRVKRESLERRREEQVVLREQAEAKKRELEQAVADQKAFVDGLTAEVARLVREEQERQERIAAERARRAAEEAARRAREEQARRAQQPGTPSSPSSTERPSDESGLGAGHPEVVSIALRYVGVPYVWGGSTPDGFDCSGLTQYVYAEIGVPLPRTSRSQYASGSHIPSDRLDLLVPGDLVFFGYGGDPSQVHHVGIYVGDGDYIHAPSSGESVRVDSLTARIASRGDYVGASRF